MRNEKTNCRKAATIILIYTNIDALFLEKKDREEDMADMK